MNQPLVFLNGQLMPADKARLNIYDLGLILGATLTEMTRTFEGRPFRLGDHVARLFRSLKYAGIDPVMSPSQMVAKTEELIAHNHNLLAPGEDLGVVHFVTPGENPLYAGAAAPGVRQEPTVCIHSFKLLFEVWRPLFEKGVHVVTPAIRHVPPQCVDPKMKNRSRLHWFLADQQARAVDGEAISLLLDLDGNITECSGANFLIFQGRTVYSPTSRNILEGVSLVTVRQLAAQMGWDWVEKDLQPYDVVNADEAWLTTTPYCVAPCTRINGADVGRGSIGTGFGQLMAAWSESVGMDILGQITG